MVKREINYARIVGHVEAAADLCRVPPDAYRVHVRTARALLPQVFERAELALEEIEPAIASGRLELAGWTPAFQCGDFDKVVKNLANWNVAADGWPPPLKE